MEKMLEISADQITDEKVLKLFHNVSDTMKVAIVKLLITTQIKESEVKENGLNNQ